MNLLQTCWVYEGRVESPNLGQFTNVRNVANGPAAPHPSRSAVVTVEVFGFESGRERQERGF